MLKELRSSAFRDNGKERPPIRFNLGLNAVLGKDDAANSIGKSSFLLAIDFAFGGRTYPTCDGVQHIGDHTICFAFQFNNITYYFSRDTLLLLRP